LIWFANLLKYQINFKTVRIVGLLSMSIRNHWVRNFW